MLYSLLVTCAWLCRHSRHGPKRNSSRLPRACVEHRQWAIFGQYAWESRKSLRHGVVTVARTTPGGMRYVTCGVQLLSGCSTEENREPRGIYGSSWASQRVYTISASTPIESTGFEWPCEGPDPSCRHAFCSNDSTHHRGTRTFTVCSVCVGPPTTTLNSMHYVTLRSHASQMCGIMACVRQCAHGTNMFGLGGYTV